MDLTNESLLDNDLIHSLSKQRLSKVQQKANAFKEDKSKLSLESEVSSSITDTVKTLSEQQNELFPEKETELEEMQTAEELNQQVADKKQPSQVAKGNNSAYYYVGAIVVAIGLIYLFQKTKGFKKLKLK